MSLKYFSHYVPTFPTEDTGEDDEFLSIYQKMQARLEGLQKMTAYRMEEGGFNLGQWKG